MKNRVFRMVAAFLCTALLLPGVFAAEVHWYFKKNAEHKQPPLDAGLSFINGYSCYYLDKKHGDENPEKVIYLTFDAGYENGNVEKILDVLKEKNVPGAFFVLKHLVEANTDLVKRMAAEGHLVCNHTMTHKNLANCTDPAVWDAEVTGLERLYTEKTGQTLSRFYRPPEGTFSEDNLKILEKMGYKTILWSFAYADWDNKKQPDPDMAKQKILAGTHNGEILLLHPTSATNAAILGDLIDEWKAQGYRFGRLDEL